MFGFMTTGETKIDCFVRFPVVEPHQHSSADGVDRTGEFVVQRPPEFAGLVIHEPPPVLLDILKSVVLEGV